ncbi:hypothetical protein GCM10009657_18910 [Oryzihumus leptocrescens]
MLAHHHYLSTRCTGPGAPPSPGAPTVLRSPSEGAERLPTKMGRSPTGGQSFFDRGFLLALLTGSTDHQEDTATSAVSA